MVKRSYQQYCSLAKALDVVGERWTLLLTRELMAGPRRYSELLANLRRMGTNLLAERLRELEGHELVEKTDDGYQLTDAGRELEPAVVALARFGTRFLGERAEGELWSAHWNVVALPARFRPEKAKGVDGVLEYRIDDSVVQARIADGEIETFADEVYEPDVVITADGETLLELASGALEPRAAEQTGRLRVEGDRTLFRRSTTFFAVE